MSDKLNGPATSAVSSGYASQTVSTGAASNNSGARPLTPGELEGLDNSLLAMNMKAADVFFEQLYNGEFSIKTPKIYDGTMINICSFLNMENLTVYSAAGKSVGKLVYFGYQTDEKGAKYSHIWKVTDLKGTLVGKLEIKKECDSNGLYCSTQALFSTTIVDEGKPYPALAAQADISEPDEKIPSQTKDTNGTLIGILQQKKKLPKAVIAPVKEKAPVPDIIKGKTAIPLYYTDEEF